MSDFLEGFGAARSFALAAARMVDLLQPRGFAEELDPACNDVVCPTPSADASGSMPLGNGDIAFNAWVEPSGRLSFYLAKSDSWSANGRLLKVGRLWIETDPPLDTSAGFEWRLDLEAGAVVVHTGVDPDQFETRLWVDANHPAIEVTIEVTIDGAPASCHAHDRPVTHDADALSAWRGQ